MTRDFNEQDKKKKRVRIQLSENPANLPQETLEKLEAAVTAALREGYLPCPVAWRIAKDFNIPRIAVGAVMDKRGVRVTDCQIGFFRVDKTPYQGNAPQQTSQELAAGLRGLDASDRMTCSAVFELARQVKTTPLKVAEAANILERKIRSCQLGCF